MHKILVRHLHKKRRVRGRCDHRALVLAWSFDRIQPRRPTGRKDTKSCAKNGVNVRKHTPMKLSSEKPSKKSTGIRLGSSRVKRNSCSGVCNVFFPLFGGSMRIDWRTYPGCSIGSDPPEIIWRCDRFFNDVRHLLRKRGFYRCVSVGAESPGSAIISRATCSGVRGLPLTVALPPLVNIRFVPWPPTITVSGPCLIFENPLKTG
jgi:hypothetical protein